MSRAEFSKPVRRAALIRSGQHCEASGAMYGLEAGTRCNAPLSVGVDFDHIIADSIGGDTSLENCAAVCRQCHKFKSTKIDTPRAAKTVRIRDKHLGISKPKGRWPSRPFREVAR